jgi:hypothetical protein
LRCGEKKRTQRLSVARTCFAGLRPLGTAGQKALRRGGTACRPLVPHSPFGTPGRASPTPTFRDCIHPFERRLRFCDPEVSTANSSWELTVGSSSKEKPTATKALTMATRCPARLARKEVAQGSLSSPSADGRLFHRAAGWAARPVRIRIILLAARQGPAPLEKPQGRTAGPALPRRTPMSERPFAVEEPLTTPYAW